MNVRSQIAAALLVSALCAPGLADAKVSKELRVELEGYVEPLKGDGDPVAKQAILLTRAVLEGKAAAKDFEAATRDENKRVRLAAGFAWHLVGEKKAAEFLRAELASDANLLDTLNELFAVLPDKTEAKLLQEIWKSATPDIKTTLARYMAVQHGPVFETLTAYMLGKDDADRQIALQAAVFAGNKDVLPTLAKLLKDKAEPRRIQATQAVIALSKIDRLESDARAMLTGQLKDLATRNFAAERLLELRDPAAPAVILEVIKTAKESTERQRWMQLLLASGLRLEFAAISPYLKAEDADEKRLAHQLGAATRTAEFIDELLKMEQSTEFPDRILAIDSLGYTGSEKATAVLSRTLFEGRTDVRIAASKGLVHLGREDALPALERALKGEADPTVKLAVIEAFGAIKTAKSLQALRFLVTNSDVKVKEQTLRSIRSIGLAEGASTLDVLLRDRNTAIQWLAFLTAMELKPELAMKNIQTALRNPPETYIDDIRSLRGENAQKQVMEYLLTKTTGSTQSDAIRSVVTHGGYETIVRDLALDKNVSVGDRKMLLLHLANEGGPAGVAVLERATRTADSKPLAQLASWLLVRQPDKNLEPTFRGSLSQKDPATRGLGLYGIAAIHQ